MTWLGALLSIYQLSKKYKYSKPVPFTRLVCYRYKKVEEKAHYITAMKTILPVLYNRMLAILPHQTEFYVTLQHWMLKIFYCTVHVLSSFFLYAFFIFVLFL